jgi:hypothetical protein
MREPKTHRRQMKPGGITPATRARRSYLRDKIRHGNRKLAAGNLAGDGERKTRSRKRDLTRPTRKPEQKNEYNSRSLAGVAKESWRRFSTAHPLQANEIQSRIVSALPPAQQHKKNQIKPERRKTKTQLQKSEILLDKVEQD